MIFQLGPMGFHLSGSYFYKYSELGFKKGSYLINFFFCISNSAWYIKMLTLGVVKWMGLGGQG